jgi:hypothetical protein
MGVLQLGRAGGLTTAADDSGTGSGWLWRRFGGALAQQAGDEHVEHTDPGAA